MMSPTALRRTLLPAALVLTGAMLAASCSEESVGQPDVRSNTGPDTVDEDGIDDSRDSGTSDAAPGDGAVDGDGVSTTGGATVRVRVSDLDGEPVPDARVELGRRTAKTGPQGGARFVGVDPDGIWTPVVRREGYAPTALRVAGLEKGDEVERLAAMIRTDDVRSFDPGEKAELYAGSLHVEIPTDAIVDAGGDPVDGEVRAALAAADPGSAEDSASPEGRGARPRKSVGSAAVRLFEQTDSGRRPVEIAPSAEVTLEYVVPERAEGSYSEGDEVSVSTYRADSGTWEESLRATVRESTFASGRLAWRGQVDHFSWWRAGEQLSEDQTGCLRVDLKGSKTEGVEIAATGESSGTMVTAATGQGGEACLNVPKGESVQLAVRSPDGDVPARSEIEVETGEAAVCSGDVDNCESVEVQMREPVCATGQLSAPGGGLGVDTALHAVWTTPAGPVGTTTTFGASGDFCSAVPADREVELRTETLDTGDRLAVGSATLQTDVGGGSCSASSPSCRNVTDSFRFQTVPEPPNCVHPSPVDGCPETGPATRLTEIVVVSSQESPGRDLDGDTETDSGLGDAFALAEQVLDTEPNRRLGEALNDRRLNPVLETEYWNQRTEDRALSLASHWTDELSPDRFSVSSTKSGQLRRASIEDGELHADLGELPLKFPLGPDDASPRLEVLLSAPLLRADLGRASVNGRAAFDLNGGDLSGFVTTDQMVAAFNAEAKASGACSCINGDLIGPGLKCQVTQADESRCKSSPHEYCQKISSPALCAEFSRALERTSDVDTDGDGEADAWSVGARVEARGAELVRNP